LEQQNAKAVEAGVLDAKPIFSFVHPETARSARPSGEEDISVDNFLPGKPLSLERLQVLDQMPDHEVRRFALSVIAVFLTALAPGDVRGGQQGDVVSCRFESRANQPFVLPGQPAEQDSDLIPLRRSKRPFNRTMKLRRRPACASLSFETLSLLGHASFD